jgi:ATP-binding cassette, subfamily C, bacterial LapB
MSSTALARVSSPWLRAPLRTLLRLSLGGAAAPLLLGTLLITLLALALPVMLLHVYDRILPNAAHGTLAVLAVGVAVALALETALRAVRGEVLSRLAARAEMELQRAAVGRVLQAPTRVLHARGDGWYAERLHAIAGLREAWSGPALQSLLDLPFTVLYLGLIWFVGGPLAAVPAAFLAALIAAAWLSGRRVRRRAKALAALEERRLNFLFDVLRGFETLKALGAEDLMERRHERLQADGARRRRDLILVTGAAAELGPILSQAATLGVTCWGALRVIEGDLTVGGLGAAVMLAGRCLQPVVGGAALWSRLQAVADRAERVAELDALPAERRADLPPLRPGPGRITLDRLRFGRQADGRWLLDDLSLEVAPGELVGIMGANGAGRSVLLSLIAGEAQPEAGRAMIDGQDLRRVDIAAARDRVALMPQDPALLRGTLLDNLTLFDPDRTDAALEAAAAMGLDELASGLNRGWYTPVGAGGAPLTRGTVQRLGLVRALAMRPTVLLIDDVTAHLDAEGDVRLCALLDGLRGRTTVVMTSHRRSALGRMDRLLVLAGGKLERWE